MDNPALTFFRSLDSFSRLNELIQAGENEGPYLECKAPSQPQLSRDLRARLGEAVSGFANSGGGVIIWGISTVKHEHSGLDVLTQIEPIGHSKRFMQQVDVAIPTLVYPLVKGVESKVLHASKGDTKGVVVTYIPGVPGDPVQCKIDNKFYMRNADELIPLPYEIIRRMFLGANSPDLQPIFDERLVELEKTGEWKIPILIDNESSESAEHTKVMVEVLNPQVCQSIRGENLIEESAVNPGKKIFSVDIKRILHRGINELIGSLYVSMKKVKRPRRVLNLQIVLFARKMRARKWKITIQLAKKGFSLKYSKSQFLY